MSRKPLRFSCVRCSLCLEEIKGSEATISHKSIGGWRPVHDVYGFCNASVSMTTLWPYRTGPSDDQTDCCMDGAYLTVRENAYVVV